MPGPVKQMVQYPYLAYIVLYRRDSGVRKILMDLWLITVGAIGEARSVVGGYIVGRLLESIHTKSVKTISYGLLAGVLVIVFFYSLELIEFVISSYTEFQEAGLYFKGRTAFTLAILQSVDEITLFGAGAGYTPTMMGALFDDQLQLHNDYMRLLLDYGLIVFCAVIIIIVRQAYSQPKGFTAIIMFCTFMFTGNPISFSIAILPAILALSSNRSKPVR